MVLNWIHSLGATYSFWVISLFYFFITLAIVAIIFAIWRHYNISNPLDIDIYTYSGSKPFVNRVKGRIVRTKNFGELIWCSKRIILPRFDNKFFIPSIKGRFRISVTSKDGYYYSNALLRYKDAPEEFKQKLQEKYNIMPYEEIEELINPLPHVDRSQAIMLHKVFDKLTAEKRAFWEHPAFIIMGVLTLAVGASVIWLALAKNFAETQFATAQSKSFIEQKAQDIGGLPPQ